MSSGEKGRSRNVSYYFYYYYIRVTQTLSRKSKLKSVTIHTDEVYLHFNKECVPVTSVSVTLLLSVYLQLRNVYLFLTKMRCLCVDMQQESDRFRCNP